MFERVRDFFFGTLARRLIFAMAAAAWFGGAHVTVPNPGWTALVVLPFIHGLLIVGTLVRSWWAIPLCTPVYLIAAASSFLFFVDDPVVTYSNLAVSAMMFASGIATIELWFQLRGEPEPDI